MRQKAKEPAQSSGKRSLQRGCGRRVPFVTFGPVNGALTGDFMFPDLARDDVFRLETSRLWLRWPRICDAAAIHKFCSRWEVARYTARIPHPYPEGSAERFVYAAREANSAGRDLTLVMTPIKGKTDAIGSISLESRGTDRLALLDAVASGDSRFFLGTDSAPHARHTKEAFCGCAGIFSAHAAIELYAEVFDSVGRLPLLPGFASEFGADFYNLPRNPDFITLAAEPWQVPDSYDFGGATLVPLRAGETVGWRMIAGPAS